MASFKSIKYKFSFSIFKIDIDESLSCVLTDLKYIFTRFRPENARSEVTLAIGLLKKIDITVLYQIFFTENYNKKNS